MALASASLIAAISPLVSPPPVSPPASPPPVSPPVPPSSTPGKTGVGFGVIELSPPLVAHEARITAVKRTTLALSGVFNFLAVDTAEIE